MRRETRVLGSVAIVALLLGLAAGAGAEGPGGPAATRVSPTVGADFRVSGPGATSGENWGAVAWNGTANEYLVVWSDSRNEATRGSDIYGRRVSAAGAPLGADFRISGPGATADDWYTAVAWNGTANEYLVVWTDERKESTRGSDVYGRRVSAAGATVGADFRISGPGATRDDGVPDVAWNGTANQYLVVWADFRSESTRGEDIYGRRVSAAGAPVGADFRISGPAATADDWYPVVAWGATANQYLVVWTDRRNEATRGGEIYGRRVSAAGAAMGLDFRVSGAGATSNEDWPSVAWNGTDNEYLVVWQDERDSTTRGLDIYGQRVSAAGAMTGAEFRISSPGATWNEGVPAVAWNSRANRYLVVWDDDRDMATRGWDVYGRRMSAAGVAAGAEFRISGPGATADEWKPAVAWNGTAGQYLVVRADDRDELTRGWDIYARRVAG